MSIIFTYLRQPLNRYTFKAPKTKAWVEEQCKGKYVLNLFAGPTRLMGCIEVTNDIDHIPCTLFRMNTLDCAKYLKERGELFDVILLDPPYSYRKSMELYNGHKNSRFKQLLDVLPDILTPAGWVITFGYHSSVMSSSRGFRIHEICLISHGGSSGSGKTSIAKKLFSKAYIRGFKHAHACFLDDFPENLPVAEIEKALCSAGFAEPPSWLKSYGVLSQGQKMRVDIARALLLDKPLIVFDEFTSVVDREVAKVGSYAVSKAVRRQKGKQFIAVTCHLDIIDWLEPDWVFNCDTMEFVKKTKPPRN